MAASWVGERLLPGAAEMAQWLRLTAALPEVLWVQFPESTWGLISVSNSSFRRCDILFSSLRALDTPVVHRHHIHGDKTLIHRQLYKIN